MFRGMKYVGQAVGSALGPKLLGTYEMELRSKIEAICAAGYSHIIDVGAAEGYYAVGLATRSSASKVTAFETSETGRALMAEMARANGVSDRVMIRGHCDVGELTGALGSGEETFLLMDCEGAEAELLDPRAIPALVRVDILVEIHDFKVPGVGALLRGRFEPSHSIEEIPARARSVRDAPVLISGLAAIFGDERIESALNEGRPAPMSWLHLKQRVEGAQALIPGG